MNTEVREKAKDFASALKDSSPIAVYFQAKRKMETDQETQALISQFQKTQRDLRLNPKSRDFDSAEIMSFRELQEKIIGSPIVREFSLAQAEAFDFCRLVARNLSELLGVDFASSISSPSSC